MIDLKNIPMFSNESEAIAFLNKLITGAEEILVVCDNRNLRHSSLVANLEGQIIAYREAIQVLTNLNKKAEEDIELEKDYEQSRYLQNCEPDNFW